MPFLGWGAGFMDYDNDGWLDLLFINGHIYPAADRLDWGTSYSQRPLLFRNTHDGKFEEVPPVKGTGLAQVFSGRGAAFGDLFNDGKIDVVISRIEGPPVLLKNVYPDHHHWVELRLVGGPKSPRDAVGATVYLSANGMRQRQDVMSGGSYVSTNDPRPHFGLGDATDRRHGRDPLALRRKRERQTCRPSIASSPSPRATASRRHCVPGSHVRRRRHKSPPTRPGASPDAVAAHSVMPCSRRHVCSARSWPLGSQSTAPPAHHPAPPPASPAMVPARFVDITRKSRRAFSAPGPAYHAQIPARDHGFRRRAIRLRQ